ncbi:uncharacterized protein LOC135942948 [Cloeon dipterum]|uniref:uncharacterized protein LOC135942948 n=1 Tax=Cloeon dipterum TaxID=197152 RepID=UPI00321F6F12
MKTLQRVWIARYRLAHCDMIGLCQQLPNLEVLSVLVEWVVRHNLWTIDPHCKLRALYLTFSVVGSNKVGLSKLLEPPNLETVFLTNLKVSKEELTKTAKLVEQESILNRISMIVLRMDRNTRWHEIKEGEKFRKDARV